MGGRRRLEDSDVVTVHEVTRLIDMTEAGDYDSYHEWSPSFDQQAKAGVLDGLMANWDTTEPDGKYLILGFGILRLNVLNFSARRFNFVFQIDDLIIARDKKNNAKNKRRPKECNESPGELLFFVWLNGCHFG